jgi:hypothetical protein
MDKTSKAYKDAVADANTRYAKHSIYKSMYISKRYRELGGKYLTRRPTQSSQSKWLRERWIQVIPYLRGKIVPCGSSDMGRSYVACRPLIRIDKNTPPTLPRVLGNPVC